MRFAFTSPLDRREGCDSSAYDSPFVGIVPGAGETFRRITDTGEVRITDSSDVRVHDVRD